jgi:ParB-like chromosome segregation protein Spo0J
MSLKSSGPTSHGIEEGARKFDELGSSIASENNTAADTVKFHPLADLVPPMTDEEFATLVADIEANGVQQKIVLYQGKILDGRNRYRAMQALKYTDEFIRAECTSLHEMLGYAYTRDVPKDEALKWVISANLRRRDLTPEKKTEVLAKLVAAQPGKSDRELAKQAGVSHPTIAKARRKAEATGKALPVDKRVGKDGKARKQPVKKGRPARPKDGMVTGDGNALHTKLLRAALRAAVRDRELGIATINPLTILWDAADKNIRVDFASDRWDAIMRAGYQAAKALPEEEPAVNERGAVS